MKTTMKTTAKKRFRPSLHIHIMVSWLDGDTTQTESIFAGSELSGIRHLLKATERARQVGGEVIIVPGYAYPDKWLHLAPVK